MLNLQAATILRPLGGSERLLYNYSLFYPRHFCIVAKIVAKRSAVEYREAIRSLQRRHPLLRANVFLDPVTGPTFYECETVHNPVLLAREKYPRWEEIVERELEIDFTGSSPLFRSSVLHDGAGATIVLTFHHSIADGLSGVAIVEDIMLALTGRAGELLVAPDSMETSVALRRPDVSQSNSAAVAPLEKPDNGLLLDLASREFWRPSEGDRISIRSARIEPDVVRRLHDLARANGTTINSAVCTALAAAANGKEASRDYRVSSPINVRELLGLNRRECALRAVVTTFTFSDLTPGRFWETARQHTLNLHAMRNRAATEKRLRLIDQVIASDSDPRLSLGLLATRHANAMVSNLGILSIPERIDDVGLAGVWGPVSQLRMKEDRWIGLATIGDEMNVLEANPAHQPPLLVELVDTIVKICST